MIIEDEKVEIVEEKNNANENVPKEKTHIKKIVFYILCFFGILFSILFIIFGIFTIYNINNSNVIAKGIYIYGIDVSNLSKQDAKDKISPTFKNIASNEITLIYDDYKAYVNPLEVDLNYDIDSAINYAFNIGKEGNIFSNNYDIFDAMLNGINITPTYSIDEKKLIDLLNNLSKELPNAVVESSYYIEDSKLIITKGTDGYIVDAEETANTIKENISTLNYLNSPLKLSLIPKSPKEVDLDSIYNEVHKDAKDAYYTTDPYTVYPSSTGVDFKISLDEAKKLLASSETICEIPLKTLYPSITTNMLGLKAFPNLLASFSTKYATSNTNRVTNLKIAASKINGYVLLPGETFSYNTVVGKRTIAAGYKEAAIYSNGQETSGLGGGICQISTTLFNAALYANLQMVEVHNHQFIPLYSSAGRDATVVYGTKDFQFKNNRTHAIKINCSVSGGIAKFSIYGVKENTEYDVNVSARIISKSSTHVKSQTFRTLKLNGKIVSTENIYNCTYLVH